MFALYVYVFGGMLDKRKTLDKYVHRERIKKDVRRQHRVNMDGWMDVSTWNVWRQEKSQHQRKTQRYNKRYRKTYIHKHTTHTHNHTKKSEKKKNDTLLNTCIWARCVHVYVQENLCCDMNVCLKKKMNILRTMICMYNVYVMRSYICFILCICNSTCVIVLSKFDNTICNIFDSFVDS